MKAIGYEKSKSNPSPDTPVQRDAKRPVLKNRDLLVEVRGVSVNPVDILSNAKIIGYDAAGIVVEQGDQVSHFKIGDKVFYSGDIRRPGTFSEMHAVDERIVGHKPESLNYPEAAALPLTSITAWEILFDSLGIQEGEGRGKSLLVTAGAGGVGSILIQLAKQLTGLTVIATASRPESQAWVKKMGADHVVDHSKSLVQQMKSLEIEPQYIASLSATEQHFSSLLEIIKARGRMAIIDSPQTLDIRPAKSKAVSFCWEYMFARPVYDLEDMEEQGKILNRVANMLDEGQLLCTATQNIGHLSVRTLESAHKLQKSGRVIGKTVLDGFPSRFG